MENENNDDMIKIKELEHKMVKFQKDSKDAAHKVGYRSLNFFINRTKLSNLVLYK